MTYPKGLLSAKPRERMQTAGMSRQPVGGSGYPANQARPPAPPERGITIPVTVGLVSIELMPVDHSRKFLYIVNNDPIGVAFLSFGGAGAALNQGFRLAPGGGGVLLDNNVPTARAFIIGTIANNPNISMVSA